MGESPYGKNSTAFIFWRGIALPGHEACRLYAQGTRWHLEGAAVFSHEKIACHLNYHIVCDTNWQTQMATVVGWVGEREINLHISTDIGRHWRVNEVEAPEVSGCIDLDLNFSPSTNTVAIRRLKLVVGERKGVTAAWLRFPSFTLEPLAQSYQRLAENLYRYESGNGSFTADLVTDEVGFVIDYPGIWKKESISEQ